MMEWLNYHHLLYFWMVVREGGVVKAGKQLRLSQPTVSGQLKLLEESLGEKLFRKEGRQLVLTEIGRVVYRYADEIFSLGKELQTVVKKGGGQNKIKFVVGVADILPKQVARILLSPALEIKEEISLICHEDKPEKLILDLAAHQLDVVLSDAPVPSTLKVRSFSHLLGECPIAFYGVKKFFHYANKFPHSFKEAPLLLPTNNTILRRELDLWFDKLNIVPKVVGEFEDSALMKAFAETGEGIFPAPTLITKQIQKKYQMKMLGLVPQIKARFYAISVERKIKHPAVVAICDKARKELFY